jgi:hypothetical protein
MALDVRGGRGIGVNPEGIDYPFVDPADDTQGLLADIYLAHEFHSVELPLRVTQLQGLDVNFGQTPPSPTGHPHTADIIIKDANDVVIFDSAAATYYTNVNFGARLTIHEWRITNTSICRVVQHTKFEDDEDVKTWPHTIIPTRGILDERVSQLLPKRIQSLTANPSTFRDRVGLIGGYNVNLYMGVDPRPDPQVPNVTPLLPVGIENVPLSGGRAATRVTISADPGDGDGRFNDCDELDLGIRTINGIPPSSGGDFQLTASQCYWLRRPCVLDDDGTIIVALPDNEIPAGPGLTSSTLQMGNDCGPCCECADYVRTYKGVTLIHDEFKDIGRRAEVSRDIYKENIERWIESKSCRADTPTRLNVVTTATTASVFLDISGSICNTTDTCMFGVDLNFDLDALCSLNATAPTPIVSNVTRTLSCNRQRIPYVLQGTYPAYSAHWEWLGSGCSVDVKFRLQYDCDTF